MKTPEAQPMEQTFSADFGNGITCKAAFDPTKFVEGGTRHIVFEWSGRPTKAIAPRYKKWIHTIQQTIADMVGKKTMHVFLLPRGRTEAWLYEPGSKPRMVTL